MTTTEASTKVRLLRFFFYRLIQIILNLKPELTFASLGGRGRYGDGPYNCNGGDGGK